MADNIKPRATILHGDLQDRGPEISAGSVDLIFTSPPYKKKDGWGAGLGSLLGFHAQRVLKPGGQLYVNFGQLLEELPRPFRFAAEVERAARAQAERERARPSRILTLAQAERERARPSRKLTHSPSRAEVKRELKECALVWSQTIAWVHSIATPSWREILLELVDKARRTQCSTVGTMGLLVAALKGAPRMTTRGHVTALNSTRVMNYDWEPIFRYWKPPEPKLDRLAIGVPYTDKSNAKRGTRGKNGDVRCRGDAWFVPYTTTGATIKKASVETKHAYAFPEELVSMVFKVSGIKPGATVMDPFCGSGTVGRVARRMGFHFVGIDRDASAIEATHSAWNTALET